MLNKGPHLVMTAVDLYNVFVVLVGIFHTIHFKHFTNEWSQYGIINVMASHHAIEFINTGTHYWHLPFYLTWEINLRV